MKYHLLIILSLFIQVSYAQKTINSSNSNGRLPWVNGELPQTNQNIEYKVVHAEAELLSLARQKCLDMIIFDLSSSLGMKVSSETISKIKESSIDNQISSEFSNEIRIEQKGMELTFSKVDEYHETIQLKNGTTKTICWQLYIIGKNIPTKYRQISYTTKYGIRSGLKSLVIPGWGQFEKKQKTKGILFLSADILALGSAIYFNNEYNYNYNRAQESKSLELRKEFNNRAEENLALKNISISAAIACMLWSSIDAYATDGAPKYVSNLPFQLNFNYSKEGISQIRLAYSF